MTVPEGNTAKRTGEISKKVKAFIITEKARARIFIKWYTYKPNHV